MENDLIKIKEDAVKIQEIDLLDTIKSIEAENTKSSLALIFASALIALLKDRVKSFNHDTEIGRLIHII